MNFHCISQLKYTPVGPIAKYRSTHQLISLQQGSIDGACGPYSIFMALLALGIVKRDHLTSFFPSENSTGLAEFYKRLKRKPALITDGTNISELENLLKKSFPEVEVESCFETNERIIEFVMGNLKNDRPVIIGIRGSGMAHWVLAVGYSSDEKSSERQFLCLDPGEASPSITLWNAILDFSVRAKGKKYPFKYYPSDTMVLFEEAIAIGK